MLTFIADIRKFWDYELFKRDFLITHSLYISSVDLVRGLRHFFLMKQPEGLKYIFSSTLLTFPS